MKHHVDIKRSLFKIKTFEVEAESQEEAQVKALELASSVIWDMSGSQPEVNPMSVSVV